MLGSNQIGHTKFVVHVDAKGKPAAVLFGSTNWTATGLCGQTNNTIVCDDPQVARRYFDYWKRLAQDTIDAQGDPKALQATALRSWDASAKTLAIGGGAKATSWFSPNTPKKRSTLANEKRPPDMEEVAQLIAERSARCCSSPPIPARRAWRTGPRRRRRRTRTCLCEAASLTRRRPRRSSTTCTARRDRIRA